jgi:hypothetical protein
VRQKRKPTTPVACSSNAMAAAFGSMEAVLEFLTKRRVRISTIARIAGRNSTRCMSTLEGMLRFFRLLPSLACHGTGLELRDHDLLWQLLAAL